MKKKKLKKKLKSFQRQLDILKTCHYNTARKVSSFHDIKENMEDTINILNDLMADIQRQINELKSLVHSYDSRLSVLDARSRVDYTLYGTNKEENNGN